MAAEMPLLDVQCNAMQQENDAAKAAEHPRNLVISITKPDAVIVALAAI